jgi:hypothetical protein
MTHQLLRDARERYVAQGIKLRITSDGGILAGPQGRVAECGDWQAAVVTLLAAGYDQKRGEWSPRPEPIPCPACGQGLSICDHFPLTLHCAYGSCDLSATGVGATISQALANLTTKYHARREEETYDREEAALDAADHANQIAKEEA